MKDTLQIEKRNQNKKRTKNLNLGSNLLNFYHFCKNVFEMYFSTREFSEIEQWEKYLKMSTKVNKIYVETMRSNTASINVFKVTLADVLT